MRIATEVLVEKYKDHLFAAAFNVCKNAADADDVVQDTFLQYHTTNRQFENEQHIRAWLIRVAINKDTVYRSHEASREVSNRHTFILL